MEFIDEQDVKFIRLQFPDILGNSKNLAITVRQLEHALDEGVLFDSSQITGFGGANLILQLNPGTVQILPWRPQNGRVARILCDVNNAEGAPFPGDSRALLRRTEEKIRALGLEVKIKAECEFYLFKLDADGKPTTEPIDEAVYFALAPQDSGENIRREIVFTLEEMGIEVESSHHEAASGQNEIDFQYDNPLAAADDLMTFKMVVKTLAKRSGYYASFMPKPLANVSGSGLHVSMYLFKDGENLLNQDGKMSETAKNFTAGILKLAPEFTAVTNPTVNSYKRLSDGMGAPQVIAWDTQNRSALVRVPKTKGRRTRMEFRNCDPSCNPYLAYALLCEAGLYGIEKLLPLADALGDVSPENVPEEAKPAATLMEAVKLMEKSAFSHAALGDGVFNFYLDYKRREWQDYNHTVHEWELKKYL
jgi:glutamine synthetase